MYWKQFSVKWRHSESLRGVWDVEIEMFAGNRMEGWTFSRKGYCSGLLPEVSDSTLDSVICAFYLPSSSDVGVAQLEMSLFIYRSSPSSYLTRRYISCNWKFVIV
jgi:hypothetical protein